MWRALSPAERTQLEELGYNRAALNSSKFATEDIAIDFGVFSGDIQRKFIGDNEFFLFTTEEPFQWNGISTNAKVYAAICIRNGYYFAFIYTDVLYSDAAYKEFLSILESITVPSVARVQFVSQSGALTMKLPEGWVIKVKNDLLDYAEFTPKIVTGDPAIVLITMDSWADLNETTRSMYELLGYDRTVIDNRFNDQAFVAKMLNQEEHSLSLWEGSNKSFYLYDGQVEVVINGETKMIRSPCAATFQDGYFFVFQLYDASCSKENQADFLALLDSVKKHNSK